MKTLLSAVSVPIVILAMLFLLSWSLFMGCTSVEQPASEERRSEISSSDQDYLAQYGDWIQATPYGDVWCPRVASSWEPFYYGEWIWSDDGWVWDSYEPYGWLVYHHGNWEFRPETGWFWVPSESWSPATVQWTEFGDYIGWAPSPPGGVILPSPWSPDGGRVWKIVKSQDFTHDHVGKFKEVRNVSAISVGVPINNGQQPDVKVIEKVLNKTLTPVKVQRHATTFGSKTYYKMVVPQPDAQRVKADTKEVEKTVIIKKEANPPSHSSESKETKKESKDSKKQEQTKKESKEKRGEDQDSQKKPTR